jgi:hypothetical protein
LLNTRHPSIESGLLDCFIKQQSEWPTGVAACAHGRRDVPDMFFAK